MKSPTPEELAESEVATSLPPETSGRQAALPANRRTVAPVQPLAADLVQRVCPALGGGSPLLLGSTP